MGNLVNAFKKFIGNKNTVTILGVIIGVFVLWFFYSMRVKEATQPKRIPCASVIINATEEITEDKLSEVEVNSKFFNTKGLITSKADLIGKYVTTGTSIPENGVFYESQVVDKATLPNTLFSNLKKGYTAFSLSVDNHTTFGNSIYPGDYIDLYMKTSDDDGKLIYGLFINSIEVLGVRDSSGKDVFQLGSTATPAELIFAVENDMYELLKKSEYLSDVTLVPVIRGDEFTQNAASVKTTEYLKRLILTQTATIQE